MNSINLPDLSAEDIRQHFLLAKQSIRRRTPKILHNKGDYFNSVINFAFEDSYTQPHLHPSAEKIEKMYLIQGSFALVLFNDMGGVTDVIILEKGMRESVDVPAFIFHTYLMLTKEVIIYETMEGVYEPETWKKMAPWSPLENTMEASDYLNLLKNQI